MGFPKKKKKVHRQRSRLQGRRMSRQICFQIINSPNAPPVSVTLAFLPQDLYTCRVLWWPKPGHCCRCLPISRANLPLPETGIREKERRIQSKDTQKGLRVPWREDTKRRKLQSRYQRPRRRARVMGQKSGSRCQSPGDVMEGGVTVLLAIPTPQHLPGWQGRAWWDGPIWGNSARRSRRIRTWSQAHGGSFPDPRLQGDLST